MSRRHKLCCHHEAHLHLTCSHHTHPGVCDGCPSAITHTSFSNFISASFYFAHFVQVFFLFTHTLCPSVCFVFMSVLCICLNIALDAGPPGPSEPRFHDQTGYCESSTSWKINLTHTHTMTLIKQEMECDRCLSL